MKHPLQLLAFVSIMLTLMACADDRRGGTAEPLHHPANAIYHWKTVYNPTLYEKDFLKKHQVKRLYLKFFDVGIDNLYDGKGEQPVPVATTIFRDSIKHIGDVEVVPVVFITIPALKCAPTLYSLAEHIIDRVDDMCWANHIAYREVQLDCDWTRETKPLFFELCHEVRFLLQKRRKGLSATIRLHQLRDTLPDIDYGVLMLYNTESLVNPDVRNSILSSDVVREYMRHVEADKHLDFAFPTYQWTLWFKDRKFQGILRPGQDTNVEGCLRHEASQYREIIAAKRAIRPCLKDIGYPSSNIIYHLDSANLSRFTDHEISEIYRP